MAPIASRVMAQAPRRGAVVTLRPRLGPPPKGAARGRGSCRLGSCCLRPSRLEDEAAGGRPPATGPSLCGFLPARLGARQLLWRRQGERGLQGESPDGRARHGAPCCPRAPNGTAGCPEGPCPYCVMARPVPSRRQPFHRDGTPRRLLPLAQPAVAVGQRSVLPLRFAVGAEDPSPVLSSLLQALRRLWRGPAPRSGSVRSV